MQKYPGLERRGSTYYFRAIIPLSLRPSYLTEAGQPRRELRVSLGTSDETEAIRLWHLRSHTVHANFGRTCRMTRKRAGT